MSQAQEEYENKLYSDIFGIPVEEVVLPDDYKEAIEIVLSQIDERQKQIILLRYKKHMTLEQCGFTMGISRERSRQLVAKALRRLRHPSRAKILGYGTSGYKAKMQEREANLNEFKNGNFDLIGELLVDDLDLPIRAYNCLKRAGSNTIKDVAEIVSSGKLLKVRNLGQKTFEEIVQRLIDFGIFTREEIEKIYTGK